MDHSPTIWLQIKMGMLETWSAFIANAPSLLLGFIILVVGWVAARMVRASVLPLTNTINRLLDRILSSGILSSIRLSHSVMATVAELAFWLTIIFVATLALRTAGFPTMADWLSQASSYIPNILLGIGIILFGYILSRLASEHGANQTSLARTGQHVLISRIYQLTIFVIALLIGLDLIGLDVTFLVALFAAAAGAVSLGLSVAFAFGAQQHVSNVIGIRAARGEMLIGQKVRIGDTIGNVLEISKSHVVLDTDEGRTLIPGHKVDAEGFALLSKETVSEEDVLLNKGKENA